MKMNFKKIYERTKLMLLKPNSIWPWILKENLTVKDIINVLHSQKEVQGRLMKVHDELKQTLKNFSMVNEINKNLIRESLEIVDFNLNYLQGMYQAPETANYSKNAVNVSPKLDYGVFDAKQ